MRAIIKQAEPPSLAAHRSVPGSTYESYSHRQELRRALVDEQGGLCCYCMGRISSGHNRMKVEHWRSQTNYRQLQLSFQNLIGACLGGTGKRRAFQHCDTRKGDDDIKWNPANPNHHIEDRIRFEEDGSIRSNDPQFDGEIDRVLNLNLVWLKNNRKEVVDGIIEWWTEERNRVHGKELRRAVEKQYQKRTARTGTLDPYCGIELWWLRQRIEGMAA